MISDEDAKTLEALEWDLEKPDPVLVARVRAQVNRCQPWWRRFGRETVADMIGVVRDLRVRGERLVYTDPRTIAALVKLSGRRPGARSERLAAKTLWALDAIAEWGSRPR